MKCQIRPMNGWSSRLVSGRQFLLAKPVIQYRYYSEISDTSGDTINSGNILHDRNNSLMSNDSESTRMEQIRQKRFNDEIRAKLSNMSNIPINEVPRLKKILNRPLTDKEKQLDEELTDFLNEFSKIDTNVSDVVKDSDILNTEMSSSDIDINQQINKYPFLEISSDDKPYTPQELFLRQMEHSSNSAKLGANIQDIYFPYKDISNPSSIEKITISKLMTAGVHLGQSTTLWRSSTQPFIYGTYKGVHIIDLNKTLSYLRRASSVIEGIAERGGIILFLGTRQGQKRTLEAAANRTNGYFVSTRWIPGTLTNPTEISSLWEKQEVDILDKPTGRTLSPDENMSIVKPDLLVILNPTENRNAIYEAMKTRVPTIGIIDTDSEPSMVTYPIPGNDDSIRSVSLLLGVLSRAGERGLKKRLAKYSKN